MRGLTKRDDNNSPWKKSAVSVNANNCVISFFHPSVNGTWAAEVTPTLDRPLPSVKQEIKDESPGAITQCPTKRDSGEELGALVARSLSTDDETMPNMVDFERARGQHQGRPDAILSDDERLSSDQEDLSSLHKQFGVKRGVPSNSSGSSAHVIPQSKKRRHHHDPYLTPDRSSTTYPQEEVFPSMEDFYRQKADQLPRKMVHGKNHNWTLQQREALCLIFMFYDVDAEFEDVAKILNIYFDVPSTDPFRPRSLRAQWGTFRYIIRKRRGYNPEQELANKRAGYEEAAMRVGVELRPRPIELKEKRLSPKCEKSKEMVARKDAWFLDQLRQSRESPTSLPSASPLATRSTNDECSALNQLLEAANSSPLQASGQDAPTLQASSGHVVQPTLLYRVYHDDTQGVNEETYFRAGLFKEKRIAPPEQDEGRLVDLASRHMTRVHAPSPFISCTDSLVWAVHRARQAEARGQRPHLSVIDAAGAMSDGWGFPAAAVLSKAKREGKVRGSLRYKASREYLVWGEIARESVVHCLSFDDCRSLTARDIGVADLLDLHDIEPAEGIAGIRKKLLRQEVVLDADAGHVLGRLTALFGLGVLSPAAMVEQFVYDVFQGWVLGAAGVRDMAGGFLKGLRDAEEGAGAALVVLDDEEEDRVKEAFVSGVVRAQQDLRRERRVGR